MNGIFAPPRFAAPLHRPGRAARDQMVAVLLAQVERIGNTPLLLPSTESTLANFTVCWTGKSPGFSPLTVDPA